MSNDYNDIDAILGVMNTVDVARKQEEARQKMLLEQEKQRKKKIYDDQIFIQAERAIQEEIRRTEPPKIFDTRRPIITKSMVKNKISRKTTKFIKESQSVIDDIKKHKIITALITAALTACLIISAPTIKARVQINELNDDLSEEFEKNKYVQQQDGLFAKTKLTIEPSEFINNLNLTPNDHMRLYIISTVIQDSDFEDILQALGYRDKENYLKKLGFEHNDFRASEQYSMEYDKKLEEMIKKMNSNPDLIPSCLEIYPELSLIYQENNTYLINGQLYTTKESGRSK